MPFIHSLLQEEAKICDFGMSKIMEEVTDISASKSLTTNEGSARYVAPELIEANEASTTMASDTYSFAMLILECVTQKAPFANLKRDAAVIHAIVNKKQCPARPDNPEAQRWITDELWELMKKCWSTAPSARPTMEEVHTFFVNLVV
jgi:serine/threonine protein kinase